jgi:hypothetical protein
MKTAKEEPRAAPAAKRSGGMSPAEVIDFIQKKLPGEVREALVRRLMMDHIEPLRQKLETALDHLDPESPIVGGAPLPTIAQIMDWFYPGCPESVAFLFIRTCQTYGLSPYRRQIKLIAKRKNIAERGQPKEYVQTWPMVIDYRVYISYAKKDPRYDYFKAELIYPGNDKTKKPTGAWIKIYMKGKTEPFYWEVDAKEVEQQGDMWKEGSSGGMRKHMLLKTVIKQGHELFTPEHLAGLSSVDSGVLDMAGRSADEVDQILDPPPQKRVAPPVNAEFFDGQPGGSKEEPTKPEEATEPAEETEVTRSLKQRIKDLVEASEISSEQYRGLRETASKAVQEDPDKATLLKWIGQLERAVNYQREQKAKTDSDSASDHPRDSDPKQSGETVGEGDLPF